MERQEDMMPTDTLKQEVISARKAVSMTIVFHLVGLAGFLIPGLNPVFLKLVPWHLLLMFLILFFHHKNTDGKLLLFFILIFMVGFAAEWLGVNRHLLFGQYSYGQTLGFKLSGVPLIIGINWFLLTYSTGILMQQSRLRSMLLRIIVGAALLTSLDFLIEPVAQKFDYWHWVNNSVPLSNYICWFFVSAFMLVVFELFKFKKQETTATVFLLMQFIFFLVLYFTV